jgi:DNA-binding response OmpR family regulator
VLRAGGITLTERERSVLVQEQPVELTQREFALLAYLMHRTNETVSRDEIVANVWTSMDGLGSNVIDVYVRRLRGKLGVAGGQLRTVRGIGYRFEPDESTVRGS